MVSNVGKLFLLMFILFGVGAQAADLKLRIVDQNNMLLKEATAGYPCKIEITVSDVSGSLPHIAIPGIEQFHMFGREVQRRSVNGVNTVTHRYTVRTDKPGVFELGPVTIEVDGKSLVSNKISLRVVGGPAPAPRHAAPSVVRDEEIDIFARLTLDTSRAVVGEKVGATLRVYVYGAEVNVHAIIKPDCASCTMTGYSEPVSGRETIKGKQYGFLEWTWDLYPTAPGNIVVPAYGVEYDAPKAHIQRTNHGFLSSFFNSFERKRIYSNAANITVSPLPETTKTVQGIGEFKSFVAHIKPGSVKQGEGAVLTLELEGHGTIQGDIPELFGMPASLKWYASKWYTQEAHDADAMPKRCFEYIVQGMEAGDWSIPAQLFFYYDTRTRTYKTLETAGVTMTVTPQDKKNLLNQQQGQGTHAQAEEASDVSGLAPLDTSDVWYPVRTRMLSWWLFFALIMLPVVVFGRTTIHSYVTRLRALHAPEYTRKHAYAIARAALRDARTQEKASAIYPLFLELFAARAGISVFHLTHDVIDTMLKNAGLSAAELDAWHDYWDRAAQASYMSNNTDASDAQRLFEESNAWLMRLEGNL